MDLAVSDFVLEHVTDPEAFVRELARVLRPGGVFIARTISRHSILAAAARVVPNDHHAKALERLQPGREERDVFRTAYKMNTRKDLARLFDGDFELALARRTGLEQYCKPWPRLRRGVAQLERHLPTLHVDGARRLRPPPRLTSLAAMACPTQATSVADVGGRALPGERRRVLDACSRSCSLVRRACGTARASAAASQPSMTVARPPVTSSSAGSGVTTTGIPRRIASTAGRPKPSKSEGKTTREADVNCCWNSMGSARAGA